MKKIVVIVEESTSKEPSNQIHKQELLLEGSTSKKFTPPSKKSKNYETKLEGEFEKVKFPTFDGETKEGVKSWLLNMTKYFQVYNYPSNLKARLVVYQLNSKEALWWQKVKIVHHIQGNNMTWKLFKQDFKQKYLNERYCDKKAKEFNDLKLGQMSIDVFVSKLLNLQRHVPYLKE